MASDILIGNYSPEEVTVTISANGVSQQITGFADGTFLTATRLVAASEPYVIAA